MPPLVYETVAWLRFYTGLPIPALPGESEAVSAPDLASTARAVPLAGAVLGWIGGLMLLLAWLLGATPFVAAAIALLALVALTAGRSERALADAVEKLAGGARWFGTAAFGYGIFAIVVAVLLRVGALDALTARGAVAASILLVGACSVSRAAAMGFALIRPEPGTTAPEDRTGLQWLAIFALGFVIVTVFPTYGLIATIAGLAAAIGAASLVTAFVPRGNGGAGRTFTGTAELVSEIAFLVAVVGFARVA